MRKFVFLILLISSFNVFAQRRWIDLAWDENRDVYAYEVELYSVNEKQENKLVFKKKFRAPKWSKQVVPGQYNFRMRGFDKRDVPGEWSEFSFIDVRLPAPIYINPLPNDNLKGLEELEEKIFFEWKNVEGAKFYYVEVWNDKTHFKAYTKDNKHEFTIPVAKKYEWRVVALVNKDDPLPGKDGNGVKFFLNGGALKAPVVTHIVENNKFKFSWSKPKYTTDFEYQLMKLGLNHKWTVFDRNGYFNKQKLEFDLEKFQGEFRFALRAKTDGRAPSPYSFIEFNVTGSDIVIHAKKTQNTHNLKKDNPFFYSYGVELTYLDYYGESRERDTEINTTFRGQRYFLEGSYQDFYSLWKHRVGWYLTDVNNVDYSIRLSEFHYLLGQTKIYKGIPLELSAGLFYKEDLFIVGDHFSNTLSFERVATMGPVAMVAPFYRFNRYFDFGAEVKLFWHAKSMETPNNEELNQSLSFYNKLYVTYKHKEESTYTFFVGHYINSISYQAQTDGGSVAKEGTDNLAESSGFSFGARVNKFF